MVNGLILLFDAVFSNALETGQIHLMSQLQRSAMAHFPQFKADPQN